MRFVRRRGHFQAPSQVQSQAPALAATQTFRRCQVTRRHGRMRPCFGDNEPVTETDQVSSSRGKASVTSLQIWRGDGFASRAFHVNRVDMSLSRYMPSPSHFRPASALCFLISARRSSDIRRRTALYSSPASDFCPFEVSDHSQSGYSSSGRATGLGRSLR